MSRVKQFKTTDNVVHDIYGQNVQGMDWDDYELLTPEQRNSDIAYFVPDAPSGLALVEQTVSDLPANVASFSNAADVPLKTLKIGIVPVQSGSGDPSPTNPRPISGWTGAEIHVADGETPHVIDNVVNVSWQTEAGEVFGGELDVTSGVLRVTYDEVDLGSLSWQKSSSTQGGFYAVLSSYKNSDSTIMMCEEYNYDGYGNSTIGFYPTLDNSFKYSYVGSSAVTREIYFKDTSHAESSASDFQSAVNGVKLVYEIATPITYQLTPTQVSSILGTNNIWADCGAVNECTYYIYGQGTKPQLYFNDDVYVGSEVIANPEDAVPHEKLDTLAVNGIVYDINLYEQSHIVDKLYEASDGDGAPLNTDINYADSHTLSDYDYITVCLCDPTTFAQDKLTQVNSFTSQSLLISDIVTPVTLSTINSGYCCVTFSDDKFNVSSHGADVSTNAPSVYSIYGVKGSGSDVTVTPTELNEPKQKIADINVDGTNHEIYAPIIQIDGKQSGAVASFIDGSANPIKSIDIGIVPLQSGSGDPSPNNIRPISGWIGASLKNRKSMNAWDEQWELGQYDPFSGSKISSNTNIRCKNKIAIKPNTSYCFVNLSARVSQIYWYEEDDTYIENTTNSSQSAFVTTSPSNAYYCTFQCPSAYGTNYKNDISINYPSTDTAYHPYNSYEDTYTIPFEDSQGDPLTIYGGEIHIRRVNGVWSGEVVDDRKCVTLRNDTTVTCPEAGVIWLSPSDIQVPSESTVDLVKSSHYKSDIQGNNIDGTIVKTKNNKVILIRDATNATTENDYKAYVEAQYGLGNPVQVWYKIAAPNTYPIDPANIPNIITLLGDNNMFADTGDIDEVVYFRDLNSTINILWDAVFNQSNTRSLSMMKSVKSEDTDTKEIEEETEEPTKDER